MSSNSRLPSATSPPPPIQSTSRNRPDAPQLYFPSSSASGGNVHMPPPMPGYVPAVVHLPPPSEYQYPPTLQQYVPAPTPPVNTGNSADSGRNKTPRKRTYVDDAEILKEYYHNTNKYPSHEERVHLSTLTGMPIEDIANWFKSKRNHDRSRGLPGEGEASAPPLKKPGRVYFTPEQIMRLEAAYARNPHPKKEERYQLACELGVDTDRIYNWFDNRRRKR